MQLGTSVIKGFAGLATICLAAATAPAATIGIDFGATNSTIASTSDEAGAPGFRQTRWNSATNNQNTSGVSLVTDDGDAGGTARWITDGGSPITTGSLNGDRGLFASALYGDGNGAPANITVTNLPAAFSGGYKLVIYYDASNAAVNSGEMFADVDFGNDGSVDVTQRYYNSSTTFNLAPFNYGYIEYDPASPTGHSNWVQTASTGSLGTDAFKLTLRTPTGADPSQRAVITALQVVAVPEPTTLGVLGLGAMMLFRRQRRVH